jgi:hypothetical protein
MRLSNLLRNGDIIFADEFGLNRVYSRPSSRQIPVYSVSLKSVRSVSIEVAAALDEIIARL